MAMSGERSSQASPMPVARLVAPGPSVAMQSPGAPVRRPVTSAAKPAEPSWAVSTKSMPPLRIASISGSTLPLGMPKPREIPADLSVATIRSALFMRGGGPAMGRALWHTSEPAQKVVTVRAPNIAWNVFNAGQNCIAHRPHRGARRRNYPLDRELVDDLVAANRTLARLGVLDAFGHISVRDPRDPHRYLISRSIAPELVSAADILLLDLDSQTVDPKDEGKLLYRERFIHGEIYKVRPDVNAVVHSHSPTVVPFTVTRAKLRPLLHNAGFLGLGVPLFEIRNTPATARI